MLSRILIFSFLLISGCSYDEFDWQEDGIILMQHNETGEYGCFGCNVGSNMGVAMCVDPAPVMKMTEETLERYCNDDFEVVEK